MQRTYKDLVFTNHALDRLRQRRVSMSEAWAVYRRPHKRYYAATRGGWVHERTFGKRQIEVVIKLNDHKEPVVLTVWANQLRYRPQQSLLVRILKWLWKRVTRFWVRLF